MRPPSSLFPSLAVALAGLLCGPEAPAGGVTIMTHGFNSQVGPWVIPMADDIPGHPGFIGTDFTCYQLDITETGGVFSASATLLSGPNPPLSDSGEIFVKLDWSSLAGFFGGASSSEVATAAVDAVLSTSLIPELGGRALAELPMHLLGHSRGGSVVTEMARLFGAQGVWVDQVTTWDPVDNTFGDGAVAAWENVLFADNYWQILGTPSGKAIPGSYNRQLTSLGGGYSSAHSDVHFWYHGTLNDTTPLTVDGVTIDAPERSSWWVAAETQGATAGFHYSRIGGGDRLSNLQPLGAGTDRINDGYNKMWDLGGGVAPNRTALPANSGLWPNVIIATLPSTQAASGDSFTLDLHHQSGAAATGDADLRVFLDADRNPWNGNETEIAQILLAHTGPANVTASSPSIPLDPATPPGNYTVLTRITDGAQTRYQYAAGTLEVIAPPLIDWDTLAFVGGLATFTVLGTDSQTVTILASEDLEDWDAIATMALVGTTWVFSDPDTATFPERFYMAVPGS